jgi:hypothetical protein
MQIRTVNRLSTSLKGPLKVPQKEQCGPTPHPDIRTPVRQREQASRPRTSDPSGGPGCNPRWAGRPHPGDDQRQDRAADMNARLGVALSLQKFLELPEVSGHSVPDTRHGDPPKQTARATEF